MNTEFRFDAKQTSFCIDFITFRMDCRSYNSFIEEFGQLLDKDDRIYPISALRFYNHAECVNNSRSIYWEYDLVSDYVTTTDDDSICLADTCFTNNYGIFVNISGEGIRKIGQKKLLYWLFFMDDKYGVKCTRIDLALDTFQPDNDIVPLILLACDNKLQNKDKDVTIKKARTVKIISNYNKFDKSKSISAYIGSRGSSMVRVYDKRYEELSKGFDVPSSYWYRIEVECRNPHNSKYQLADTVFKSLKNDMPLNSAFRFSLETVFTVAYQQNTYETLRKLADYKDFDMWLDFIDGSVFMEYLYKTQILCKEEKTDSRKVLERYFLMFFTALQCVTVQERACLFDRWRQDVTRLRKCEKYRQLLKSAGVNIDTMQFDF